MRLQLPQDFAQQISQERLAKPELQALGHYRLLPKRVNNAPVWRQSASDGRDGGCLLVKADVQGRGWRVLAATGGSGHSLLRLDDDSPSPHLSNAVWHHRGVPVSGLVCADAHALPSASDVALFEDEFTATQAHLTFRRPGRGEGLADHTSGLCLFSSNVSPNSLRQGGLGDCWLGGQPASSGR